MLEAIFYTAYPLAKRAAQVHSAAATIVGSLPAADRQDLEQEGLLAFWRSLPQFDSSKASIRTFAERVVANEITSVVRAQRALRRIPVSTDTAAHSGHPAPSMELRTDVQRALAVLNKGDRRLAALLAEYTPTEASRILRKSRSTVYEGIRRIRVAFLGAGIAPVWASSGDSAQAKHGEQIGTCLTLRREVA
jgi:RNA polymerase sigma factor (sigma-70 family)